MIAFERTQSTELATASAAGSALLAPSVPISGPVKPGDRFPISFPIRADGGTDGQSVRIRFFAEAAVCMPDVVDLGALGVNQTLVASSEVTVLPLNGKRSVKLWTAIECGELALTSEPLVIPISARGHLVMSADDDGECVTVRISNDGTAPLDVSLELLTNQNITCTDPKIERVAPDRFVSDVFTVGVGEERVVQIGGGAVDQIVATSDDGERASTLPLFREPAARAVLDATLRVDAPVEGVRRGDSFALVGTVAVRGGTPASDVLLVIEAVSGAELRTDEITINGIRPIAADVFWQDQSLRIRLGHLAPENALDLRVPMRATIADPRSIDTLRIEAELHAAGVPGEALTVDVAVDRRPAFQSTSTYLGPIIESDDRYAVVAEITNADGIRIERVRVRFEASEVVPDKIARISRNEHDPYESPLRPSALNESANLFVDLGGLDPGERVRVVMPFRPARGQDGFRTMVVRATLLADEQTIALGTSERRIPGRVSLGGSSVHRLDDSPLRLGMPTEVRLEIRNDGDSPAHDVRLAIEMPPAVGTSMPDAVGGARWRPLIPKLPPGGAVETTVVVYLQSPPASGAVDVRFSIDAREVGEISLGTLTFLTPSDSLIDPPRVRTHPLEDGQIALLARVMNLGDGPAHQVIIWVEDPHDIVLRTTAVDGQLTPDLGAQPVLASGLDLGDLQPGAYRDVTWIVAPRSADLFQCSVAVRVGEHGEALRTRTIPARPRHRIGVSNVLPSARRVGAEEDLSAHIAALSALSIDRARATVVLPETPPTFQSNRSVDLPPQIASETIAAISGGTAPAPASLPSAPPLNDEAELATRLAIAADAAPPAHREAAPDPQAGAETSPPMAATPVPSGFAGTVERPAAFARLDALDPTPAPEAAPAAEPAVDTVDVSSGDHTADVEPVAIDEPEAPFESAAAADAAADTVYVDEVTPPVPAATDDIGDAGMSNERVPLNVSYRTAFVQLARRMGQSMIDVNGLGWWRHIMFIRAMLPERLPVDGQASDAWSALRGAFIEPLKTVFPSTVADPFFASDAFVDALGANDASAIDALDVLISDRRLPIFVGVATGSTMLDVALPNLLPDSLGDATLDEAWGVYKGAAARIFASPSIQGMSEVDRRVKYGNTNATLDEALTYVLRAFPE